MKNSHTLFLALIIMLGISSCQKTKDQIDQATEFDINYSTEANIPSTSFTTVTTPVDITTPEIATNSASNFSANKTTQDLVSEIKMTKFNISTSGPNLDFLKSVSFYIKIAGQSTDQLIAKKDNIPPGTTSTSAVLEDVNIKNYIIKDKIQFRASFLFQTGSSSSQNLKLDQTVHVKATLIK